MTQDEELDDLIRYVRAWHMGTLKKFRDDGLPKDIYETAVKCYGLYLKQANRYYKQMDLRGLRSLAKSLLYFTNPWGVTIWYATQPKKKAV